MAPSPETLAQEPGSFEPAVEDVKPLLSLKLPKGKTEEFLKTWRAAEAALASGHSADARRLFGEVIKSLDELETTASQRENALWAKATIFAHHLGDRTAAKRELDRLLERNPNSKSALSLAARLAKEEAVSTNRVEGSTPTVLSPRVSGTKGRTP